MEISKPTIGIFYLSKVLGLAPYFLKTNSKGKTEIHRSITFTIYSLTLITALVTLTYRGLLFDANSKIPVRASFRMKSATSKVVTAMDVSVVVFASLSGVICGIIGLRATQDLNRRLKQIDETLSTYANEAKDRLRGYIMMVTALIVITIMLGFDVLTWTRMAKNLKEGNEDPDQPEPEEELNVQWYIPFYSLYYILTGLHIHFAQSAVGLGRRYRRLNLALKNSFVDDVKYNNVSVISVSSIKTISSLDVQSSSKPEKKASPTDSSVINAKNLALITRLAYTHESLGKAIKNVSGAFGLTVLFMLISCLLHLVATAYFLFLAILGSKDVGFSWLQLLWIIFHGLRLLLIVEPCHVTTEEAQKTILIICEIQRSCTDSMLMETMTKFWQQLLSDRANFSACGMCKIDRQILTSWRDCNVPGYPDSVPEYKWLKRNEKLLENDGRSNFSIAEEDLPEENF